MRKVRAIVLSMVACGTLFAQVSDAERALVQDAIPGTQLAKVEKGEIEGLYKAFMDNGRILYVYPFGKKIIFGDIYTSAGVNLSEADRIAWQKELSVKKHENLKNNVKYEDIKKLSLPIEYNGGNDKYILVMITDPQCPYCKKAEEFLASKKASVEYVYSVVVHQHTLAPEMIETILSSKDPKSVIMKYIKNEAVTSVKSDKSAKRYEAMNEYARTMGITGTPMFVVIDKKTKKPVDLIEGARTDELQKYID